MRIIRRPAAAVALVAALGLAVGLSACATPRPGGESDPSPPESPASDTTALESATPAPADRVTGTGMVMDDGGDVSLCLGAVAQSYPPKCAGIPVEGWSWDDVDGSDSQGDKRWGDYTVTGTYDGETFTITADPAPPASGDDHAGEDPTDGTPGTTDPQQLQEVLAEVSESVDAETLMSGVRDGYVWLTVVWDDGTLQDAADAEYGPGVVVIESVLQPAPED